MRTTIKDVAKKANVAPSTVTKVLKNYQHISPKTKEKVLKIVKELNYIPNLNASNLSSKNKVKIALYIYINNASDEINLSYITSAFEKANLHNIEIITIFNESVKHYNPIELTTYLIAQGINGIVVYGLLKDDLLMHELINQKNFHFTLINAPIINDYTSSISINHLDGQYNVAKKLITEDLGNNVLYLSGDQNNYVCNLKIEGIKKLQTELKFNLVIYNANFSEKHAYEYTIEHGEQYDCIVCASDLMAIGAINALRKLNIYRRCCGYDGIKLMSYAGQEVYTLKQDFNVLSSEAIDETINLINGNPNQAIIIESKVIALNYNDVVGK